MTLLVKLDGTFSVSFLVGGHMAPFQQAKLMHVNTGECGTWQLIHEQTMGERNISHIHNTKSDEERSQRYSERSHGLQQLLNRSVEPDKIR